ncbi:polysaccharide deacetylase family protein [Tepidibacillus sp. HK-1]|uniref:polysaccharide deacetylase family protein n=1 Tax=Tepidibacillus sp. HK-1 TaxID=1883407 RepID=UPI000852B6D3|nr:polysaccharide deacetylase family protein [Tepidibacillus sp. HK-1]GBF10181.1 peptidoglycan-N-acetylglucosamine deacetylase [Tepidibacillus sp. HK-1]
MVFKKKCLISLILVISQIFFYFPTIGQAESADPIYQTLLSGKRILKERNFIEEEKATVYLTFDDGPSELTPKVLDILKKEGIKATFFVVGKAAEQNKKIIKRIVEEGHSIGNHSYTHQYKNLYSSFSDFWQEIQKTEKVIYDITGIRTSLVRTPGGTYKNWDSFYFYFMDQADYLVYDWNVDSGDSKRIGVPAKEIIATVKQSKVTKKLIVLMHDSKSHVNTVGALPSIIKYYKEKGYQFKALSEQVEPIIQPETATRWKRNNEFEIRDTFVREVEKKKIAEVEQKEEQKDKLVDVWMVEPYYEKIGEVIYSYQDEMWWLPLKQAPILLDTRVMVDERTKIIRLYKENTSLMIRGQELKRIGHEWYIPLIPAIQVFQKNIHWNEEMTYLILEQDEQGSFVTKEESIWSKIISSWETGFQTIVTRLSRIYFTFPSLFLYTYRN